MTDKKRHCFFKYCERCGKRFQPRGRFFKYCDECVEKRRKEWRKK